MNVKIIGASVQGASHKRTKKECQDSFKSVIFDDAVIIAVADGHGSSYCPYSKSGSTVAVNVFVKLMTEYCNNYSSDMDSLLTYLNREGEMAIARVIDFEWKRRIKAIHKKNKRETIICDKKNEAIYKLYGTTLIGIVATPSFYFAFQLGDGDIVRIDDDETNHILTQDRILGTETYSLSQSEAWRNAKTAIKRRTKQDASHIIMLATDGFCNSYPSNDNFYQACRDYYTSIKTHGIEVVYKNLKNWLNETSENGSGDDITTVFLVVNAS